MHKTAFNYLFSDFVIFIDVRLSAADPDLVRECECEPCIDMFDSEADNVLDLLEFDLFKRCSPYLVSLFYRLIPLTELSSDSRSESTWYSKSDIIIMWNQLFISYTEIWFLISLKYIVIYDVLYADIDLLTLLRKK